MRLCWYTFPTWMKRPMVNMLYQLSEVDPRVSIRTCIEQRPEDLIFTLRQAFLLHPGLGTRGGKGVPLKTL